MKGYLGVVVAILLAVSMLFVAPVSGHFSEFSDVTLYQWNNGSISNVWDLTRGDLVLSYTLDMSNLATPGWTLIEVGLRQVGAPNIDPNLQGGWLQSVYKSSASNDNSAEMNDYHVLMKHGWSYEYYDATGPEILIPSIAPWSYTNYAFYFDRDGVDQWQETYWNYKDGVTYNTEGVYDVVITFHAIDETTGTMFVTINGEEQGFYTGGYDSQNPPQLMPVGRTFTADMTHLQVFYGRGGGGGFVTITNFTAEGTQYVAPIDEAIEFIGENIEHKGTANSLISKLECAKKQFLRGNEDAADNVIGAYLNSIYAQGGKKIDPLVAKTLIVWAQGWLEDSSLAV